MALRGGQRPTQTGLPIPEKAELYAFLELSHQLMPTVGFDRAMSACARVNAELNVRKDKEMYEIAAPIIRIVPAFTKFTSAFDPPTIAWYRTVGADLA